MRPEPAVFQPGTLPSRNKKSPGTAPRVWIVVSWCELVVYLRRGERGASAPCSVPTAGRAGCQQGAYAPRSSGLFSASTSGRSLSAFSPNARRNAFVVP